ncbi:hypothetical protein [Streptomyces albipurpureus]|uniref:Transmembrane protein n=1 Tax=Streptomyces albipurpureus TaxID=2897419 RepID=A0ABT0ULG2_9ACTN|nr:hypothetical protein [Streptomyces sp. CWNU-1]MCM2388238.1 hypothetical protein [Streptomyces sp. CWNU-1]
MSHELRAGAPLSAASDQGWRLGAWFGLLFLCPVAAVSWLFVFDTCAKQVCWPQSAFLLDLARWSWWLALTTAAAGVFVPRSSPRSRLLRPAMVVVCLTSVVTAMVALLFTAHPG